MPTALILSATSDIARSFAKLLASKGYDLVLAGRNIVQLETDSRDIEIRFGTKTKVIQWDALDFNTHPHIWNSIQPKPELVACFTGYLGNQKGAEQNHDEMLRILHSNYTSCISMLELAAAEMEKNKSGGIIGISSVAGDRGRASNYYYGSSKAGFSAYLSGLRNRMYASGVHVMTVKPGFVRTKMTEGLPLNPKLTASPDQVAADIWKGWQKKKNVIYSLGMWKWIMAIICNIPEWQFKKMKL